MNNEIDIKIYRDGRYSLNDNIRLKLRNIINRQINKIDHFFEQY